MARIIPDDMEFLIDCIKKRPALYLKSLKEYSDIKLKKILWEEVCLEAVPSWGELDGEKRLSICAEVQRKWNNLRTCFSRELKAQRTISGPSSNKRHKYIYFEKLLFLKSCMSDKPVETNIELKNPEEKGSTESKKELMRPVKRPRLNILKSYMSQRPIENSMESSDPEEADTIELVKARPPKQPSSNFQESMPHNLKEDLDEDKNFVLSLVPTLKSLTEDEKFQAKIEFLQVLRKIKNNRTNAQKL